MSKQDHLTENELSGFYRGELSAHENRRVVRHLLTGCAQCRELSAGRWKIGSGQRPTGRNLDELFERAAEGALDMASTIETERQAAPAQVAELSRHPVERQRLLIANSRRFRGYGLAETLIEGAFQAGFRNPRAAVEQAEVGVAAAAELSAASYGQRLVNDLRARAWGTLGNAQRIASWLPKAERSILRGLELADSGTGDPSERARLLSFLASLRVGQRRFEEALSTHDEILRIHRSLGDRHQIGRTYALKAFALRRLGENDRAIELSEKALDYLDPERNINDVAAARHGLAHSLLEVGRLGEAQRQNHSLREEWSALGNELNVVRCEWLDGKIAHRRGQTAAAEELFEQVHERLVELEVAYDAALVSLDWAEALFDQGKTSEMARRLGEAIPVFQGLGVHREAIAALAFLQQASELERVTTNLIRATARFVEEARQNPELVFQPSALSA